MGKIRLFASRAGSPRFHHQLELFSICARPWGRTSPFSAAPDLDSACLTPPATGRIHRPSRNKLARRNWQQKSFAWALGLPVLCSLENSTALSQHKSSSSRVHAENGIPGTEQNTSGNESISQTVARAPGAQGSECWAAQDAGMGPGRFYLSALGPGLALRAPVTASMPGVIPSHPQVRSWDSLLPFSATPLSPAQPS